MFDISLPQKATIYNKLLYLRGTITIGVFSEPLDIPVHFWKISDYEKHWEKEIQRIKNGATKTALITAIFDDQSHCTETWPLYKKNDHILIQNRLIFPEELKSCDIDNIANHVHKHETTNEDGNKISEWKIHKQDLYSFLNKLKGR